MKLKLRDKAGEDRMIDLDPLDLASISVDLDDTYDDPLFDWIKPSHLDQPGGATDPEIVGHAQAMSIDVDCVMAEKVGISSDEMMKKLYIPFSCDEGFTHAT
uniref:Uncharacterized protein n=1 Tax=Davidia involucrata TaxID=16924 RepID=A0A5B7BW16_DAVIN